MRVHNTADSPFFRDWEWEFVDNSFEVQSVLGSGNQ